MDSAVEITGLVLLCVSGGLGTVFANLAAHWHRQYKKAQKEIKRLEREVWSTKQTAEMILNQKNLYQKCYYKLEEEKRGRSGPESL